MKDGISIKTSIAGISIKTSMATIDINLTANDEQTLNILRDSLIGWYEGFCTDCLDNGISCETTFSREEIQKPEVKQELNKIYGMQYADTDSVKVSAPAETAKTRKHVYDMFKHFKAVTTTECKECDECAKVAADYVINLEKKINGVQDNVEVLMKDIIHIFNFLSGDEEYLKYVEDCEAEKWRGDESN